jgi:hypothetical protein
MRGIRQAVRLRYSSQQHARNSASRRRRRPRSASSTRLTARAPGPPRRPASGHGGGTLGSCGTAVATRVSAPRARRAGRGRCASAQPAPAHQHRVRTNAAGPGRPADGPRGARAGSSGEAGGLGHGARSLVGVGGGTGARWGSERRLEALDQGPEQEDEPVPQAGGDGDPTSDEQHPTDDLQGPGVALEDLERARQAPEQQPEEDERQPEPERVDEPEERAPRRRPRVTFATGSGSRRRPARGRGSSRPRTRTRAPARWPARRSAPVGEADLAHSRPTAISSPRTRPRAPITTGRWWSGRGS